MHTESSHSLRTVLDTAQEIARTTLAAIVDTVDADARWPEEGLRALQSAELGGLVVPATLGGLGHGLYGLARVCEVLAQTCPSTAMCFGMHCVGAAVLAAKATPEQRARYLEPINQGRHLTTLALSEPGTGSHFYLSQTELRQVSADTLEVEGTKSFVTNGGHADSYVISTLSSEPDAPPGQFSMVVIDRDSPGMAWGQPWKGLGMRGNSSRDLQLRSVPISRENLLGHEGDQTWYVFSVVAPYFLMAMAGTYLGIATAAIDELRTHLTTRRYQHSGSTLAQQPVIQHRLGTLWGQVERTRRLIYYAAAEADTGDAEVLPALLAAKAEVADCAVEVVNEAMTLAGGIGYRDGSRFWRMLRDARAAHVMAPTTDILRTWVGRFLLAQPLLGD